MRKFTGQKFFYCDVGTGYAKTVPILMFFLCTIRRFISDISLFIAGHIFIIVEKPIKWAEIVKYNASYRNIVIDNRVNRGYNNSEGRYIINIS